MISESEWISRAAKELKRINLKILRDNDEVGVSTDAERIKVATEMWEALDPWDHQEDVEEEVRNEVSYWHD